MSELLRLEHIYFQYEEKYPALKDVSVTINEGERIALLGNNGAGKSTFFLCCNGVLRPQRGKIFLSGREISSDKRDILLLRQSVGLVFQEPDSQIIAGTVESEVSFGPMNLRFGEDEVRRRVKSALDRMNLDGYQSRAPHYLSGGEKKRVSIADILAMEPRAILLDEPTAGLDNEHTVLLEQTLDKLHAQGMTLLVSTHDTDLAWRFADRAVIISDGEVIADAPALSVFADSAVLARAGLKKPVLFEASEALGLKARPKTMEEFRCGIKRFSSPASEPAWTTQEKKT